MFRSESARERTLLRLIEQQQRIIAEQNDRLMLMAGHTWTPPPLGPVEDIPEEDTYAYSAFDGLPPTYSEEE